MLRTDYNEEVVRLLDAVPSPHECRFAGELRPVALECGDFCHLIHSKTLLKDVTIFQRKTPIGTTQTSSWGLR